MGSVSRWTEVIPECLRVNPGHLGQFSNIFTNYSSLLSLQSNIEPNYLLWILWEISKIMGSVSGWTEVILRALGVHTNMCLWCYTPKGITQRPLINQSIWDQDSIYWPTWWEWAYDTVLPKGMIKRSLTGQSIWDRDSIHWPTQWEWAYDIVLPKGMIQRSLTGWSIWDQDSIHQPTRWEWAYNIVLPKGII